MVHTWTDVDRTFLMTGPHKQKQNRGGRRREAASMIAVPYRAYAVGVDRATHVGTWFYVPRFVTVCVLEEGSCPPVGSDSDLAQHSP